METERILFYGRKDIGTGILRNRSNGGEGPGGFSHTCNTKLKMKTSHTGTKKTIEERNSISKRMIGNSHKLGYKDSEVTRKRKSLNKMGNIGSTGKMWICNGERTTQIPKSSDVPIGWVVGRHFWSSRKKL